ncbi:hypothetical protein LWI29_030300 [Acer saccharum]|uniref:Uncharacterized protein n=1 Tax=Acer saccharum TaxID=4024 RepID=A0AA39W4F9_ACESA|nr:hypothetical protein LWI29_030300 [Acer saccharum]
MPTDQTGYVVSSSHVADAVLIGQPSSTLPQGIVLPLPNNTRPEIARSVPFVLSLVHQSPFEKVQQQDSLVHINQAFTTIIRPILNPKGFSSSEPSVSPPIPSTKPSYKDVVGNHQVASNILPSPPNLPTRKGDLRFQGQNELLVRNVKKMELKGTILGQGCKYILAGHKLQIILQEAMRCQLKKTK